MFRFLSFKLQLVLILMYSAVHYDLMAFAYFSGITTMRCMPTLIQLDLSGFLIYAPLSLLYYCCLLLLFAVYLSFFKMC